MKDEIIHNPVDTTFYIQVESIPEGVIIPQSEATSAIEKITKKDFNKISTLVEAAGSSFVQQIREMASNPSSCEIEFGISLGAEGGVPFFTKGTIEANFKVTIKWELAL